MDTVPAFGYADEVEEVDVHEIEDWTLYVFRLDDPGNSDVVLNADVTPIFGRNYKMYLTPTPAAAGHRVTHVVRPSKTVDRCHIPTLVRELLTRELGLPLLEHFDSARKFKEGIFVRAGGMAQHRYADRIDTATVTGFEEASEVGRKIVPVLGEIGPVKAGLRTGQGKLGIEFRDGFWALGLLILDETRLRVLKGEECPRGVRRVRL